MDMYSSANIVQGKLQIKQWDVLFVISFQIQTGLALSISSTWCCSDDSLMYVVSTANYLHKHHFTTCSLHIPVGLMILQS